MMATVVALCGRRRSGKDTVAAHLVRGGGWDHIKVSNRLKTCVMALFDLTENEVEGPEKDAPITRGPGAGTTPRRILQWLGTNVMQHALARDLLPGSDRRFWIDRTSLDIRRSLSLGNNVVISDVRFPHELDVLEQQFGANLIKIFISRQGAPANGAGADADADAHESELAVESLLGRADCIITNREGRIDAMLRACDACITKNRAQRLCRDHDMASASAVASS